MDKVSKIVIVGGGLAAAKACGKLRELGWAGGLTVVTREAHPPYERPPLSKGLLLERTASPSTAYVETRTWSPKNNTAPLPETQATGLDPPGPRAPPPQGVPPFARLPPPPGPRPRRFPESMVSEP